MNYHDLTRLLIKIMGLFILAWSITQTFLNVGYSIFSYQQYGLALLLGGYVIPSILAIIVGLILFLGDRRLANRVVSLTGDSAQNGRLDFHRLEQIGIALLGLYLSINGMKMLIGISAHQILSDTQSQRAISDFNYEKIVEYSAQLLIGILIFLCSNGIATFRQRFLEIRDRVRNLDNGN